MTDSYKKLPEDVNYILKHPEEDPGGIYQFQPDYTAKSVDKIVNEKTWHELIEKEIDRLQKMQKQWDQHFKAYQTKISEIESTLSELEQITPKVERVKKEIELLQIEKKALFETIDAIHDAISGLSERIIELEKLLQKE